MSTVSNVTNLNTSAVAKKRRSSTSSSSSSSSSNSTSSELTSSQPITDKINGGSRNNYFDKLAELISASIPDMTSSLSSSKPDKSAILQETVNQIRKIKQQECEERNAVQQSDVSSSKPTFLADNLFGPLFLEALDGFVFVVNTEGKFLFVSSNVTSVLKYEQDDLVGKIIYDFIYISDHSRFSNSLLPLGGNSSDASSAGQKGRSFNCRLRIKKCDLDDSMENQYENMQISSLLLSYPFEKVESTESDGDAQDCLVCIAHRIPTTEGNNNINCAPSEKFTTKLNLSGTILAVDTSGVSAKYSQYLNKDLVGRIIYSLCHAYDHSKLNQHIKEAIQSGNHVSHVYRLMISKEKYLHVQTTSKKISFNQLTGEQEFLLSTHSIIRESEIENSKPAASSQQNSCTNSVATSNNNNTTTTSCSTASSTHLVSVNNANPDTLSSNYPTLSLSQDLNLNDFGLDMFNNSNWDNPLSNSSSSTSTSADNSGTSGVRNTIVSWPASTISATSASTSAPTTIVTTATYTPDVVSTSTSVTPSPSLHSPGAAPLPSTPNVSTSIPFSNSFPFSPVQEKNDDIKVSPTVQAAPSQNITFESSLEGDAAKKNSVAPLSGASDSQVSVKLRDLLTQGMGDNEASSSASAVPTSDIHSKSSTDQVLYTNSNSMNSVKENCGGNIILRELLNQEEDENLTSDDKSFVQAKINEKVETTTERSRRASASSSGVNPVLRTVSTNAAEADSHRTPSASSVDDSLLKSFGLAPSSSQPSPVAPSTRSSSLHDIIGSHKRHSSEDGPDTSVPEPKRPNLGSTSGAAKVHLAGQNPMLASMLAQTPKQTHIVPTSIANALVSEIPQKKLPGDLEKKLVYTPITRTQQDVSHSTSNTHNSIAGHDPASFAQNVLRPISNDLHKDGSVACPPSYSAHGQSQGFLSNLLMAPTQAGGLPSHPGSQHSAVGPPNTVAPSASNSQVIPVSGIENIGQSFANSVNVKPSGLNEFLNSNATLTDVTSSTKIQPSDPVLSEILDAVCNMQQDIDTPITDDSALLKILDEVLDPQGSFPGQSGSTQSTNHDVSERMAISAITKQLMSVEPSCAAPHTNFSQQPPAYSSSQLAPPTYTQSSNLGTVSHPPHPAFQPQSAPAGNHAPPNYPNISQQQRPRYQSQQSMPNQIQSQQFHNLTTANELNNMPPQVRQALLMQKQKHMRDQQQRLMQQQQHQQIMIRAHPSTDQINSSPIGLENMNDLLNNTIAPNVSLQRSTSLPDSQLSPRFTNQQLASPASTTQISPGNQRQSFGGPPPPPHPSSQYQRTSPAPAQISPVPGFFSSTSSADRPNATQQQPPQQQQAQNQINFANNRSPQAVSTNVSQQSQWSAGQRQNSGTLQQQNPMLNAQLSQATFNRQSNRHPSAGSMRSLPSPHSPFSQQDASFPSLQSPSPAAPPPPPNNNVIYQQQQQPPPQARIKRTISVPAPGRVNSPRTPQGQFLGAGQENIMSPQPQMSPSYAHSVPNSSVSSQSQPSYSVAAPPTPTSAVTPSSAPPAYSGASVRPPSSDPQFSFDQQNLQLFSSNSNGSTAADRARNQNVSSEYVKQEIRTMIGARTHYQGQTSGSGSSGQQQQNLSSLSFQPSDLEALGLSMELDQELNSGSNSNHIAMPPASSPRMAEEGRPEQKNSSLLKQLLSE